MEPTFFGYSVARWERETLVVSTAGFNDKTWLMAVEHRTRISCGSLNE
jgi:hypothetical protein